ncbi:MAG: CoA activase, partial [Bacteroidales bacterium]|nr:CoA activase [Bacteroidales bacterium]
MNKTNSYSSASGSCHIGFDIGSVSLNTVVLSDNNEIIEDYYDYIHGKPFNVLKERLTSLLERYPVESIQGVAITGSGGKLASELIGGVYVNEIIAQATSTGKLYPDTQTVIEIGGEDSKMISLHRKASEAHARLVDFEMNSICAAGTGSFLDQQARRIGVPIEKEFGLMALKSENPPRIAGRCSVFAKSDMIHLQQIATPLQDIVAGLCFALARNFRSNVARSKEIKKPVVFSGGVAANIGMVRAFKEILNLNDNELIIPKHHASMGAIGAVYYVKENNKRNAQFKGMKALEDYLSSNTNHFATLPQLKKPLVEYNKTVHFHNNKKEKTAVYLGLDIGSLSTNVVLIDNKHQVVARRYLR